MEHDVFIQILETKATSARLEEKLLNIERYVLKDFKTKLEENTTKIESRFRWVVGLFVTFIVTSIGVSISLYGGGV